MSARWRLLLFGLLALAAVPGCASGSDACAAQDCSGHGACTIEAAGPRCLCDLGYVAEGLTCLADPCRILSCIHGHCDRLSDPVRCVCDPGYDGVLCDGCAAGYHPEQLRCLPDEPCRDAVCVHGTCREVDGQAVCECLPGYAGVACDACAVGYHPLGLVCLPDTACDPDPCVHGACAEGPDGASCSCEAGYAGALCSACAAGYVAEGLVCVPAQGTACDPNPCLEAHRGQCVIEADGAACRCDPGYVDEAGHCVEELLDPCHPNPCLEAHRTVCLPQGVAYQCACDPDYHDDAGVCVADVLNPCDPNPCQEPNQGVCVPDADGHSCRCDPGYQDHDGDGACAETCASADPTCPAGEVCADESGAAICVPGTAPPVYVAFHWHMHQPVYWPYENIAATEANNRMGFSVYTIHHDRAGPYTSWPRDAVDAGRQLPHLGAQVSLSGSLMENLDNMSAAGAGFDNWKASWVEANAWSTSLGNPRLDLVLFGYHHPLMGLIDAADLRLQVQAHRLAIERRIGAFRGRGMFPPECAFSPRMIPALVAEGVEWVLVDNIHFDRAHVDYPWVPESNLAPPNRADQLNQASTEWLQLNGLWAPSRVGAPWGYRPHWVEHRDPQSGAVSRIVAVPAARYEGNEDARGGFGALQYEAVFSQYEHLNTDSQHPMLVVLHHDGDNYGGGTDSYYHANFQAFVAWVQSQPDRFVATTIQDYLDQFPPDDADVIHVEDGSWSGADNGDPEFMKWNGDPATDGYSPDRNSWSVITAVKNRVLTAEAIAAHSSVAAIVDNSGNDTDRAWHYLLNAETSCYWYWDNSADGLWDSHPTRAANQAAVLADQVIANGTDTVGPTIYLPQREPYNPGLDGLSGDFAVWTLVDDLSGLDGVILHYRVDADGLRDQANDLYAGGTWQELPMTAASMPPRTDPLPLYQAAAYEAAVTGLAEVLIDYYVSASDSLGNQTRSPLMHVWVGPGTTP